MSDAETVPTLQQLSRDDCIACLAPTKLGASG